MSKHPNDAVIRAWLDGKTIQHSSGDGWEDWTHDFSNTPLFGAISCQWRVKPVHKFAEGDLVVVTNNAGDDHNNWNCFAVGAVVRVKQLLDSRQDGIASYYCEGYDQGGKFTDTIHQTLTEYQVADLPF